MQKNEHTLHTNSFCFIHIVIIIIVSWLVYLDKRVNGCMLVGCNQLKSSHVIDCAVCILNETTRSHGEKEFSGLGIWSRWNCMHIATSIQTHTIALFFVIQWNAVVLENWATKCSRKSELLTSCVDIGYTSTRIRKMRTNLEWLHRFNDKKNWGEKSWKNAAFNTNTGVEFFHRKSIKICIYLVSKSHFKALNFLKRISLLFSPNRMTFIS